MDIPRYYSNEPVQGDGHRPRGYDVEQASDEKNDEEEEEAEDRGKPPGEDPYHTKRIENWELPGPYNAADYRRPKAPPPTKKAGY